MENDFDDDYPLLDFMLDDDFGNGGVYAEDQVVVGPDGPELAPIELSWDNDEDCDDDDYLIEQPKDEEEYYYPMEEKMIWTVYEEEWEDYC